MRDMLWHRRWSFVQEDYERTRLTSYPPEIRNAAGGAGSALGTGGMASKIDAAEMIMAAGIDMVVTSGKNPEILFDILNGADIGTFFVGKRG